MVAAAVLPEESELDSELLIKKDQEWVFNHVLYDPSISLAPLDALKTHFASLFQSWALFDQSSLAYDNACPSIQNVLSLRTCDQCGSYYGSQALLKNHSSIHKTKKQHKIKAKKVLSSRKDEVLVIVNDEEPEWMSREDVDIQPPQSCELLEEDQVLPVFTLDENFSMPWESFSDD